MKYKYMLLSSFCNLGKLLIFRKGTKCQRNCKRFLFNYETKCFSNKNKTFICHLIHDLLYRVFSDSNFKGEVHVGTLKAVEKIFQLILSRVSGGRR